MNVGYKNKKKMFTFNTSKIMIIKLIPIYTAKNQN